MKPLSLNLLAAALISITISACGESEQTYENPATKVKIKASDIVEMRPKDFVCIRHDFAVKLNEYLITGDEKKSSELYDAVVCGPLGIKSKLKIISIDGDISEVIRLAGDNKAEEGKSVWVASSALTPIIR